MIHQMRFSVVVVALVIFLGGCLLALQWLARFAESESAANAYPLVAAAVSTVRDALLQSGMMAGGAKRRRDPKYLDRAASLPESQRVEAEKRLPPQTCGLQNERFLLGRGGRELKYVPSIQGVMLSNYWA